VHIISGTVGRRIGRAVRSGAGQLCLGGVPPGRRRRNRGRRSAEPESMHGGDDDVAGPELHDHGGRAGGTDRPGDVPGGADAAVPVLAEAIHGAELDDPRAVRTGVILLDTPVG